MMKKKAIRQCIEWAMEGRGKVSFREDGKGGLHISIQYMTDGGNQIPIMLEPLAVDRGMRIFMKEMVDNLEQWIADYNSNDYVIKKIKEAGMAMDVRALLEDVDRAREDLEWSVWRMKHLWEDTFHGLDSIYGGEEHRRQDGLIHIVSQRRAREFLEAWLRWEENRIRKCPPGQVPLETRLLYRNKLNGTWGAMDNEHGDCWVEEFFSPWAALDYLFGKSLEEIRGKS